MAAPPPYWKKKTRPCPFYSQGRCLFSDACNFVHSVKVNHDPSPTSGGEQNPIDAVLRDDKIADVGLANQNRMDEPPKYASLPTRSPPTLSRTPSEKRRRVVLMSPPRSPRLSGLLSALEDVIGPDVEEVEVTDEEDGDEDGDGGEGGEVGGEDELEEQTRAAPSPSPSGAPSPAGSGLEGEGEPDDQDIDVPSPTRAHSPSLSHSPSPSSSRESTSLPYCQDSPASGSLGEGESMSLARVDESSSSSALPPMPPIPSSPNPDAQPNSSASLLATAAAPTLSPPQGVRPPFRTRVPSPIITQRVDRDGNPIPATTTTVLDNNTLEVHSHHHSHPTSAPTRTYTHTHNHNHIPNHTDDPCLTPLRPARRHSTFELLTSPFASPAHRILSPQLFPVLDPRDPASSVPVPVPVFGVGVGVEGSEGGGKAKSVYGDDDVESLETVDSSVEDHPTSSSRSSASNSSDSLLMKNGEGEEEEKERLESGSEVDTCETSVEVGDDISGGDEKPDAMEEAHVPGPTPVPLVNSGPKVDKAEASESESILVDVHHESPTGSLGDVGSPHDTERPPSDYFCTPRNRPSISVSEEVASLPSLPPTLAQPEFADSEARSLPNPNPPSSAAGAEPGPGGALPVATEQAFSSPPRLSGEVEEGQGRVSPSSVLDDLIQDYPMGRDGVDETCEEESNGLRSSSIRPIPSQDRMDSSESPARLSYESSEPPATRFSLIASTSPERSAPPHPQVSEREEVERQMPLVERPSLVPGDLTQEDPSTRIPAGNSKNGVTSQDSSVHVSPILDSQTGGDYLEPRSTAQSPSRSSTVRPVSSELSLPVAEEEPLFVLDDLIHEYPSARSRAVHTSKELANGAQSSPAHSNSSRYLAPLSTSRARGDSLESPATLSFGPSPVTPDYGPLRIPDTIAETESCEGESVYETILERRAKHTNGSPKRLAVVSLTSPTKELRESYFPASAERTVRPTPSPLYEDSHHSASGSATPSSVVSSPRPSWAELQRRAGICNKVPFGFRQSLLVGQEESSSLAQKLASQFSRGSSASRTSSTASLSPTSALDSRRASRVDMLSGRARSVSPAFAGPGPSSYRHSVASHSSSAPSVQIHASDSMPRSASQAEFFAGRARADSPVQAGDPGPSSRRASWMKPLRLSQVYSSTSSNSRSSSPLSHDRHLSTASIHSSQHHVRNESQGSLVQNSEPSSARSSLISTYLNSPFIPSHDDRTIIANGGLTMPSMESVFTAADSTNNSLDESETVHHRHSQSNGTVDQETSSNPELLSPLSGSMRGLSFDEFSHFRWSDSSQHRMGVGLTVTEDIPPDQIEPSSSYQNTLIPPPSTKAAPANIPVPTPCHAIATPRPTLMFAIASDNPAEVERVLASGEARPNDVIGPQSALEFALTNDALVNKTEIVKTLLAFGADPSALPAELRNSHKEHVDGNEKELDDVLTDLPSEGNGASISKRRKRESTLNPAMKYYLNRATAGPQAAQTSAALRRTDFRPLARMRFDFVGQDRALEHLYWVLGMHSQQPIGTPLVVLCCGPCGHGKSLLARKFGSLLDVPTHTVNMTVLKTSHDLWQCPSMSPYDPPSDRTLAEFLEANAGKRCVVVLDEIDKNEDERTLWSLLAPWELGRCSIDAGRRHIDVRNVIWLGTSNIGQDLVFEHHAARNNPDTVMSKPEYRELMNTLRPLVTEKLGTSLMSRVTAVLPFVPFTHEEKLAIASEAILALGGETASELGPEEFERLALQCVSEYVETDGARSLYRSVSTHLMEAF